MCEIPSGYFTIARAPDETRGAFIRRVWRAANPTLPDDLSAVSVEALQSDVVFDGYESPYRFGRELRRLADAGYGPVFGASHVCERGSHTVYYCFGPNAGRDGPDRAAFYSPAAGRW